MFPKKKKIQKSKLIAIISTCPILNELFLIYFVFIDWNTICFTESHHRWCRQLHLWGEKKKLKMLIFYAWSKTIKSARVNSINKRLVDTCNPFLSDLGRVSGGKWGGANSSDKHPSDLRWQKISSFGSDMKIRNYENIERSIL